MNAFHGREVDHQAAIDRGAPGHVVAAAADRHLEAERTRQLHGIGDIRGAETARDERRALVHEAVVHPAGLVIARVGGLEELTRKRRREFADRSGE